MRTLFALTLLAAAAPAQRILTVGPGGFAQIAPAIAAAVPGDFVEIAPGTYRPFVLDKGITLRATGTSTVNIVSDAVLIDTVVRVPRGQHARISGLTFGPGTTPSRLVVLGGLLSIDACYFNILGVAPSLEVNRGNVTAWCCGFSGGRPAVLLRDSNFAAVQCGFNGSLATQSTPGGNGLEAFDSSVQLAWCQPRGGHAINAPANAGNGLVAHGTSLVWVTDSIVAGGNSIGTALPGIGGINNTNQPVRWARTSFEGGTNPVLPPGLTSVGPYASAPLLGITMHPLVFRIGATHNIMVQTPSQTPVVLVASLSLQPPVTLPVLAEPVWGPPGNSVTIAFGFATGTVAPFPLTIPNNPAFRNLGLWLHAVGGVAQPPQISPPAGSIVR